ncbi:Glycerol kinase [Candidatus Westeberhardia cardiocondylae]|uniref:Glycerol kinase n=1 Tax=Candidatus Westeberhardia cardiocondylae TaxID=1594731 RepID=A0A0H5BWP3_9ENTR|nr:glycerol kinase GlpK [Candidatus Westeberhardia cardiocondylae]CEN32120.1 Glycerol kinase [Candidatus Westeberhardia cardiocondylae]
MTYKKKYIVSLDQGTTISRAIVFDCNASIIGISKKEITQIYPNPGWVEHDPIEIWNIQYFVFLEVLKNSGIDFSQISGIGITNQRETIIVWDKKSGKPIYNAIVWQCRRTADFCEELQSNRKFVKYVRKVTGLVIDPYFSATKIKWILDFIRNSRIRAYQGEILCGTVDSWLIWNMTKGKKHITDYTNASRTMLFNIHTLQWDNELLNIFDIPISMLPRVCSSSEVYGKISIKNKKNIINVPISGIAGDQQAALFGQLCVTPGSAKITYGTGCFLLMNTGDKPVKSKRRLLTTIVCGPRGELNYALEGMVFMGGAIVQWLRDEMKLIRDVSEMECFSKKVHDTHGVYIIPTFSGLASPFWDPYVKGSIFGLTRGVNSYHIVRAALESVAFQIRDIIEVMQKDYGKNINSIRVSGGVVINNFLMQFQSDILNIRIDRSQISEISALGVAYLAGLSIGFWKNLEVVRDKFLKTYKFYPNAYNIEREYRYCCWKNAIVCTRLWKNMNLKTYNFFYK